MQIRQMKEYDLDFAVQCTMSEGWTSEDREVFKGFLGFDPEGCFIAEKNGDPIGMCIATSYETSGFIGELIIVPEMRGRSLGKQLLAHALIYLRDRGVQQIYLDGVPEAVSLYKRVGFKRICRSHRFIGKLRHNKNNCVKRIRNQDLETIWKLDRQVFGEDRSYFLRRSYTLYPKLCMVLKVNRKISGYIFGRFYEQNIALGPWVVLDDTVDAGILIENFPIEVMTKVLSIGILENNKKAISVIRSLGFHQKPAPPYRMVLRYSDRGVRDLGMGLECYGIGSAAKG